MDGELDPRELERELEGSRLAAAARDAFFATPPAGLRTRSVPERTSSGSAAPDSGRSLIARRPAPRQRRYERVIAEESLPADRIDYKLQICCASAVLEEEVVELLAEPLRPSAALLATVMRDGTRAHERTAEFLDRWGAGKEPPTLGLVTMGVLVAARRGLNLNAATFGPVLDRVFAPDLVAALSANWLGPTLDQLRMARNAACHPVGEFDEPAYRAFVACLVGNTGLMPWEREGAAPLPIPPTAGFLHRLLTGSRLLPPVAPPTAIERLTALAAPRIGAFALEIVPTAPVPGRTRNVSVEPPRAERAFRLGGELVLRLRADRDCHLTLIDLGTSGAITLLLPNAQCPRPVLKSGVSAYFPGPEFVEFVLTLRGRPGRERLVALATPAPLADLPAAAAGSTCASLTATDVERIVEAVRRLSDEQWSAAVCEFTIEG
jgi:hypothetical protein